MATSEEQLRRTVDEVLKPVWAGERRRPRVRTCFQCRVESYQATWISLVLGGGGWSPSRADSPSVAYQWSRGSTGTRVADGRGVAERCCVDDVALVETDR
jgi:hypothetical protein